MSVLTVEPNRPAQVDIVVWQDDALTLTFALKQADGSPVDLTGSTLRFRALNGGAVLFTMSSADVGSGLAITDAAAGLFTLSLTEAQATTVTVGRIAQYKVERSVSGVGQRIFYGFLIGKVWAGNG